MGSRNWHGGPGARLAGMFAAESVVTAREVWDGLLWAARPVRVVADEGSLLLHWCPAGATGCFATSRFFPGREDLSRDERQLVSLETRQWHYRGVPARGTSLTFVREGAWASVAPTWFPDGRFAHWYVNFQRPLQRNARGYDTLDLVLDIVVAPDWSWAWKDRGPFDNAIGRGIFDRSVADAVEVGWTFHRPAAALLGDIHPIPALLHRHNDVEPGLDGAGVHGVDVFDAKLEVHATTMRGLKRSCADPATRSGRFLDH